jgi:hypothetical protein
MARRPARARPFVLVAGAIVASMVGACTPRSSIVLKDHPLQYYVLGRYQMKVPSNFVLASWSAMLRQVTVVAIDAPLAATPEEALDAYVKERTRWLRVDEEPEPRESSLWDPTQQPSETLDSGETLPVVRSEIAPGAISLEVNRRLTVDESLGTNRIEASTDSDSSSSSVTRRSRS